MDPNWSEDLPIYRQLRDRVVEMILEGVLVDGDALPSVRNVAAEYRLNPLTVLKGYQELVDEGLVEKKRGRGMFVTDGAQQQLLKDERERFVDNPVDDGTGTKLYLMAPLKIQVGERYETLWAQMRSSGYVRIRVDGQHIPVLIGVDLGQQGGKGCLAYTTLAANSDFHWLNS